MGEDLRNLLEIKMFQKCKITNNQLKLQGKRTRRGKENNKYKEMRDFYLFYTKINKMESSFICEIPVKLMQLSLKSYAVDSIKLNVSDKRNEV